MIWVLHADPQRNAEFLESSIESEVKRESKCGESEIKREYTVLKSENEE